MAFPIPLCYSASVCNFRHGACTGFGTLGEKAADSWRAAAAAGGDSKLRASRIPWPLSLTDQRGLRGHRCRLCLRSSFGQAGR